MSPNHQRFLFSIAMYLLLLPGSLSAQLSAQSVSGRITDQNGKPLNGIGVLLANRGYFEDFTVTDADGQYRFEVIYPNYFTVIVDNEQGFINKTYDGILCPPDIQACDFRASTFFWVGHGEEITAVDFSLEMGGEIAGTLRDQDSGQPIARAEVQVYADPDLVHQAPTDEDGTYLMRGFPAGSYVVQTRAPGYRDQVFDDLDCQAFPTCDFRDRELATAVEVEVGQRSSEIDFDLDPGQTLTGRLTQTLDGSPASGVSVVISDSRRFALKRTQTDPEGNYQFGGLIPDDYFIWTESPIHFNEIYPNQPCEFSCEATGGGEPIAIGVEESVSQIDLQLDLMGVVSGRITDAATGQPIAGIELPRIFTSPGAPRAVTDQEGRYMIESIPTRMFEVSTINQLGWVDEAYDDVPCPFGNCDFNEITRLDIQPNAHFENIDFALDFGAQITGRVLDEETGEPIAEGAITLFNAFGDFVVQTRSNSDGSYLIQGLNAGSYTFTVSARGYNEQLYEGFSCLDYCDPSLGVLIDIDLGDVVEVGFELERLGSLSGTVIDAVSGLPITGAVVRVHDLIGPVEIASRVTDAEGRYHFPSLRPRDYAVEIAESSGHEPQLYQDMDCLGGFCEVSQGTPVSIENQKDTTGIDFALTPREGCVEDAQTLCLNDGRFRVQALWSVNSPFALAEAVPLTADSGYFWFFNADNVELVVKVLDGCPLESNHFWFFTGGLTDVETVITVTDTWTGDRRIYDKSGGQPFQSILDTQAFNTCDATTPADAGASFTVPALPPQTVLSSASTLPEAMLGCQPGPEALCLNDGRFKVETSFSTLLGDQGSGQAMALTQDSGYFWFFNDDNVEVVVKVLNGCSEPQGTYWVFAAGLTDVEVNLRVTDTLTGEVREYVNDQSQIFEPILDTQAFATCP